MKIKEFCNKNKKKVIIISVSMVTVLVITTAGAVYCVRKSRTADDFFGQGGKGGFSMMSSGISASGVTSVGVTQVNFEVENLETKLEIQEVYVSSGEEVEAGNKILKLSEESVAKAREELEKALRTADLAYRAGAIEYEQNVITAKYDYNSAILSGEQASDIYDETIAGLKANREKAQKALEDAQKQISEYEAYVNDGSYNTYFKLDEYQALYDENLRLLTDRMSEWGISWSQITGGGRTAANTGVTVETSVSSGDAGGGSTDSSQYVKVLTSLYSVLEQNLKDLEKAQSDYEDAMANAGFELQTLKLSLPALSQAVSEAEEAYETQVLQAKLTYETSLAGAQRAQDDYETALEKAQSDYEDLKNTWKDAKENLELFENSVGDGYFYASDAGTILRTMVRAEQYLTTDSTVFVYSNPLELTVTVSVDQSDIAEISVGDEVTITTGSETFRGTVTQINPVTASNSRTSVTYNVTVTLSGDTGQLSANQSVTVIFGVEGMELPGGGQRPEGEKMPEGQKPVGAQMPDNMEMEQGEEYEKNNQ